MEAGSLTMPNPILKVEGLRKLFPIRKGFFGKVKGYVRAVDGVSFSIGEGRTMGLVGESGCGKTTVGRCVLRLIEPTSGKIIFNGVDITRLPQPEMRRFRRHMQIVFQDPYASLNPRLTVKDAVSEPLSIHGLAKGKELRERARELLLEVGLTEDCLNKFPHEFSGGQRQRICIARALALRPKFVVLDEPTSSLDVSVQAQILNLLKDLQRKLNLTYLFISHDLSVINYMSDDVAVMYLGKIVEVGSWKQISQGALHPYTNVLFSSIPALSPRAARRKAAWNQAPDPTNPPGGCRFHPRCPSKMEACEKEEPKLREVAAGHSVACHLWG